MAFDMTLVRLKRALTEKGGGVNSVNVPRRDLEQLLYHFHRLDHELRAPIAKAPDCHIDDPAQECQKCQQQFLMINRLSFALIAMIAGCATFMIATWP